MDQVFFVTDQFRIEKNHFFVLRKGFVTDQLNFNQILKCEIKKGSSVNHPILLVIFGLVCCLPICWFLTTWADFLSNGQIGFFQQMNSSGHWRTLAIQLIVVGFCSFVGFLSVRQALTRTRVLMIRTIDSKKYRFDLLPLEKNDRLEKLISFLKDNQIMVSRD